MADELPEPPPPRGIHLSGQAPARSLPQPSPWWIYRGTGRPLPRNELAKALPPPPPWRSFDGGPPLRAPAIDERDFVRRLGVVSGGRPRQVDRDEVEIVNTALLLRRPLLVTGPPGVGKSTLAYRVAWELGLGRVLRWPISSRSTLRDGLYEYDAIGRAQDAAAARQLIAPAQQPPGPDLTRHADPPGTQPRSDPPAPDASSPTPTLTPGGDRAGRGLSSASPQPPVSLPLAALAGSGLGDYLRLGPLGTALLPYEFPRVLLVDELDKSDIDLPNDLLDVLEEGEYQIAELERVSAREADVVVHTADPGGVAEIHRGHVRCRAFPLIFITSNGEREFPPAFLRRCLLYSMKEPDESRLADMVVAHFAERADEQTRQLVRKFLEYRGTQAPLAADQLLNAAYLTGAGGQIPREEWERILDLLWLRSGPGPEAPA